MSSDALTVDNYLKGLPEDRRAMVDTIRSAVLRGLPDGFEETIQYGMISYVVPLGRYPVTYNKQPLAIRSEEHTSELQSRGHLVCRLLLEKKKSISKQFDELS